MLLAGLAHGSDLRDTEVFCARVGEAAARLLAITGVAALHVASISEEAQRHLQRSRITVSAKTVAKSSEYTAEAGEALVDAHSRKFDDENALFEDLRRRLLSVIDGHHQPSDLELMVDRPTRLGTGGGGT